MSKRPSYVIVGRGRWARRMAAILEAEGRAVCFAKEARRLAHEDEHEYRCRLTRALTASKASVAWLCVPPGEHIATMIDAALDARLHVVVEQPWFMSDRETQGWMQRAAELGRVIGVHYEYCLLDELERWSREYVGGQGYRFGGVFHHSRSGHLGLPAMDVLGTHLLAMREFAAPDSTVGQVNCGYELADERQVWLESADGRVAEINFLGNEEPLIQRYVHRFEAAMEGASFPLDPEFAMRVVQAAEKLKDKAIAQETV